MLPGVAKAVSWEYLTKSNDGEITVYVDLASIKKQNGSVKVWTLTNNTKPEKSGNEYFMSSKGLIFVNCDEEKYEISSFTSYSGAMGNGSVVDTYSLAPYEFEWKFVTPDTLMSSVLELACPVQ